MVVTPWLDDRQRRAILEQAAVMMAVGIDESGRQRQAAGIDDCFARFGFQVADCDDALALDAHGAVDRRRAGAVHDAGIDDQRGVAGRRDERSMERQRREQRGAENRSDECHSEDSLTRSNGRPRRPKLS